MHQFASQPRKAEPRDLFFFANPKTWPTWPFLAVIRRHSNGETDYGVLYDCLRINGRTGYSATVFLTNIFQMPPTETEFLCLPREVFDTPEEIAAAGWVVD